MFARIKRRREEAARPAERREKSERGNCMELIVVTGLSGAGKSRAAAALEDMGILLLYLNRMLRQLKRMDLDMWLLILVN